MPLNLITDPWIPVRLKDGGRRVIRPHEMADATIAAPDWPRADLNVACLELLIGLVFVADPPQDDDDWDNRQTPDPARLAQKLLPFKDAFNLDGEGPRFMQDLELLEGEPNPPDMLFIDSAGVNTAKNNADLMVRRERYESLDTGLAAMAIFAFQAFAPSGGAGNRTSMRGGGPLTTLIDLDLGLWSLIWANVPYGPPQAIIDLPWMRATKVSDDKKPPTFPENVNRVTAETLFGMPRRLRLVFDSQGHVSGVIQRPYGTNYIGWVHPLTPYYRMKPGSDLLPKHPGAGKFGYRNWLGIVAAGKKGDLSQRAACVGTWQRRNGISASARLLVAGWAMDNMKPRDFILSSQPLHQLTPDNALFLSGMVEAANVFAIALRRALEPICEDGERREALREAYYQETQEDFETCVAELAQGAAQSDIAVRWRDAMRDVALTIFEQASLPGLADRKPEEIEKIVEASGFLWATLAGFSKDGANAYEALNLPLPLPVKKKSKEAA